MDVFLILVCLEYFYYVWVVKLGHDLNLTFKHDVVSFELGFQDRFDGVVMRILVC